MALLHNGFFLLRSPLYPVNMYREILQGSLQELADQHPLFIYALCIASKDLLKELERYLHDPSAFNRKKTDKLRKSLYKYWVRACTRSTPYGLFAGCTTGSIGDVTSLQLNSIREAYQYVRLDMDYYTRICNHIQQLPAVNKVLRYYPNNSIYKTGDKYRYAEYSIVNNRRKYLLTAVEDAVFIERIIREAATGLTIPAMVQLILAEDNSILAAEAEAFVQELVEAQLLISDLEPVITGTDNLATLINRLTSIEAADLRDGLIRLQQLFHQQDFEQTRLAAIQHTCETVFPLSAPKDLLQIDLFKTAAQCTISETLTNNILAQVNRLLALCHGYTKGRSEMADFAARFRELYESQEVPLNLVLDGETGIGYGTTETTVFAPFVEDVPPGAPAETTTVNWSLLQQLCLDKYEQFLREGAHTVMITDEELDKLGDPETVQMARSCYLFGTLLAPSAAAADKGDYLFAMQAMGGPSAANLLGRFCNGDALLAEKVKTVLADEAAAYPDVVMAEVVHFPEARAANVLIRPGLRAFEIPYIGVSGVAADCQIPVSDLTVSVSNNEVILKSKRLNKRVIPRLSSAHNYSFNSLPVYKFLCDLQHQSVVSNLSWDWGVLASRQRLPRVMYKNIILSRACWTLTAKDLEHLGEDEAIQLQFFASYRAKQGMPEKVLLTEADNELLIDLGQPTGINVVLDHVRKASTVKLKECLLDEQSGVVRDQEGNTYAHELLIPLTCTLASDKPRPAVSTTMHPALPYPVTRSFTPGSEWLYVKIYCGFKIAEELLAGHFAEQVLEWQEDGLFEQFFFLRYADPQPHIRLRFLNSAHPASNDVILHRIATALQKYIQAGQVQKIQCDTYVRELERYGANTITCSEQLFYSDSMAVLGILSLLEGADGEMYRWKLALRGADMLLDDFGLTLPEKKQLLAGLRAGFTTEFGGAKLLHKPLNDKYRKHQQEITSFLQAAEDDDNGITEATAFYRQRSAITLPVAAQIRQLLEVDGREDGFYHDIVASHLHMFLNRIFVARQRKHELVLYHFLERYYLSQSALVTSGK